MRALVTIAVSLTCGACAEEAAVAPLAPAYELRDVVRPALALAEAAAPEEAAPTELDVEGREALEGALAALSSPDAKLRGLALEDVRAIGPGAVPALARELENVAASPAHRSAAAQALGAIATPSAAEALARALESSRDVRLRTQCAFQLGAAGDEAQIPRLILRLKYETDGETVLWIADSLARLGNLAGLDGLVGLCGGAHDAQVGERACGVLSDLARQRGFTDGPELHRTWRAGDPEQRLPVCEPGLRLVREAWRRIALLSEWDLRKVDDARFVLARLDGFVVPMLAAALRDADVYTRVHAAQCLERRGPLARAAVPALVEALAEPRVAPGAAIALGAIGDASAAARLEALLAGSGDMELRIACARSLGVLRQASAATVLRAAVAPVEPLDLRQAAAGALVALGLGDEVAPFLLECLTAPRADAGAAESALAHWLSAAAERGDGAAQREHERWRALEPPVGSIATAAEVEARRRQRFEILRPRIRP